MFVMLLFCFVNLLEDRYRLDLKVISQLDQNVINVFQNCVHTLSLFKLVHNGFHEFKHILFNDVVAANFNKVAGRSADDLVSVAL